MRVVAGSAKGRRLLAPDSPATRPIIDRVKTALFDILAPEMPDATVLDLFGGVGSVGIEALSRGAQRATFVEIEPGIVAILRENLRLTRLADRAEVVRGDAFAYLDRAHAAGQTFDLVYVAPPQYQGLAARALRRLDAAPLTAPGGLAVAQIHPKERGDFDGAPWQTLRLADERRYGSTLLLFYRHPDAEESS